MFRNDSIPERVIAFGRKLAEQKSELDVTDTYTTQYMSHEFYSACEEVNQMLIAEFRQALPIVEKEATQNKKDVIVLMRVIQVKHQDCYVLEKQFWVKAKNCFGLQRWYKITDGGFCAGREVYSCVGKYEFKCIGRTYTVPWTEVTVKDFYYKI